MIRSHFPTHNFIRKENLRTPQFPHSARKIFSELKVDYSSNIFPHLSIVNEAYNHFISTYLSSWSGFHRTTITHNSHNHNQSQRTSREVGRDRNSSRSLKSLEIYILTSFDSSYFESINHLIVIWVIQLFSHIRT